MVGTGHIHPIDLDNLISRTKSTILSDQSFREDFLYHYASLKNTTQWMSTVGRHQKKEYENFIID